MVAKIKHHIRKDHRVKLWGMGFPGDSSISSTIIIMIKLRQNLGNFDTKRVKAVKKIIFL